MFDDDDNEVFEDIARFAEFTAKMSDDERKTLSELLSSWLEN